MTPENRRPQAPATKEVNPSIVPVAEGGERGLDNAPSIQDITDSEIPTLLPNHSGELVLTDEERNSDEFQKKTDALRAYHQERTTVDTAPSHTARNVTIGAASLLLVGGTIGGVAALNNQPSNNTPPETEPSATSGPVAGETQAPAPTNVAESPLASPTNLGPLETEKPTPSATPEVKTTYTVEQLKAMTPAAYNALPRAERLVLIQDMLKDAKDVSLSYGDVYKFNPLDVASKDNTAQEIMNQIKYTIQLPLLQKESPFADEKGIDKLSAQKAMSAAFYDVSGEVTPLFTNMENKIQKTSTILEVTDKYSNVKEVGPPQTAIDQEGKEIQYRTITFLSSEVNTHTAKVVFTQIGNDKGIWQLYDFNDKA